MCHLEHASTPVDGRGGGDAALALLLRLCAGRNGGVPPRAVLFVLYVVFVVFVLSTARCAGLATQVPLTLASHRWIPCADIATIWDHW